MPPKTKSPVSLDSDQVPTRGGQRESDRGLIAERAALHANDEPELLDVLWEANKGEAGLLSFVSVEKLERLKISQKLIAMAVPFWQCVEIRAGLLTSGGQVAPGALLFNQRDARPEQVDEARRVVEPRDTEDLEEGAGEPAVGERLGAGIIVAQAADFSWRSRACAKS